MPNPKRASANVDNPKPKAHKATNGSSRAVEFVNCHLDTADKDRLRSEAHKSSEYISELCASLTECNRLSVKFDEKSSRFVAYLFDDSLESVNRGCALCVRGATVHDALYALAYAHLYKYEQSWGIADDSADAYDDPWG